MQSVENNLLEQAVQKAELPRSVGKARGRTVTFLGLITILVALVGYVREAAIAARFGISAVTDAYFAAIFIPLLLYLILITGTFSTVLIPILLEQDHSDRSRSSETFSVLVNFVLLVLVIAVGIGLLGAGKWLPFLFGGFSPVTSKLALRLTYIVLPAVMFLGMAGVLSAALNAYHRFVLPAFAPALPSLAIIAVVFLARGPNAVYYVAIATALGFLLQCLVLVPAVAKIGIRYQLAFSFRHASTKKLIRLGLPLFLYLVVAHTNLFVERNLASHLAAGAVAALTYALRLFVVPSNFLAAPLATVMYPDLARTVAQSDYSGLRTQTCRLLRLIVFVFLPISVWFILNALPVTRLLYERGHFRFEDSIVTARVLTWFSIGILPNAIALVLLRCFYAVQDTITPLIAELVDLGYYLIVAHWLVAKYGLTGLAVTRGGSFFVVATILIAVAWRKRALLTFDRTFGSFIIRTVVAAGVMGLCSWGSLHILQAAFDSGVLLARLGILGAEILLSGVTFLGIAALLRLPEAKQVASTLQHLIPLGQNT